MTKSIGDYKILNYIDKGSQGNVYLGIHKEKKLKVAIKKISKNIEKEKKEFFINELKTLS